MLPAEAAAGKIFDFNLTMPIMVAEFVALMVFLDKTWFTPVGAVLDARDKLIREKLGSVTVRSPCSSSAVAGLCPVTRSEPAHGLQTRLMACSHASCHHRILQAKAVAGQQCKMQHRSLLADNHAAAPKAVGGRASPGGLSREAGG